MKSYRQEALNRIAVALREEGVSVEAIKRLLEVIEGEISDLESDSYRDGGRDADERRG